MPLTIWAGTESLPDEKKKKSQKKEDELCYEKQIFAIQL